MTKAVERPAGAVVASCNRQDVPAATIVIVTKNRLQELRTALRSAVAQSIAPEVIVVDDGSDDGTAVAVATEFPDVCLIAHRQSEGYIRRRNEAAAAANGAIVFSIDDDAEFRSTQTVEQTLREFDSPRIGAVAIPCIEPKKGNRVFQQAPDPDDCWITDSYIGTAHAVRRDVFLRLGGYEESLVHQGEERDFCLRLLTNGLVVRLGRADAIHHYESPKRDTRRLDYYGRRNDIIFTWQNVPMVDFPLHLMGTTLNGVTSALRAPNIGASLRGMAAGFVSVLGHGIQRRPVCRDIYRLHRRLRAAGSLRFSHVEHELAVSGSTTSSQCL